MTDAAAGRQAELAIRIKRHSRDVGFDLVGIADPRRSDHLRLFEEWLASGWHGEMAYLARPDAVRRRADLALTLESVRSVLIVAHDYYLPEAEGMPDDRSRGVIARYARGRDYHKVVKRRLQALRRRIEADVGRPVVARVYVDSGPILERELAQRAGLGWFGKNTMLINPGRGSYFFLGALLLDLDLPADAAFAGGHCGTCRRCLDACPTGALKGYGPDGAPIMDARLCISYLTIEHRGAIPRELRLLMGNRIFGCDICQEVCPWNGPKFVQITTEPAYRARRAVPGGGAGGSPHTDPGRRTGHATATAEAMAERAGVCAASASRGVPGADGPRLLDLMRMSEAEWDEFSRGSAIRRARRAGFLRNVAVALGNWGSPEAVPVLAAALSDPEPLVRGHVAWALGRIGTVEALGHVRQQLSAELDPWVREELESALTS
ncbi:MAG: tRNA epoxyqueuosine(34) reductase QueG [Gemmatimonadetes bacterium]|nr:tRNA epoxyqueuosine(34) reductase QueG [Gemmatimonadota bacterium]